VRARSTPPGESCSTGSFTASKTTCSTSGVGAFFHQARTVCRRAERECVALMHDEPEAGAGPMRYLNRLSDYLFVAGRWAAHQGNEPEPLWERPKPEV